MDPTQRGTVGARVCACRLRIGLITEWEQYKFCYRLIADAIDDMLMGK